MLTPSLNSGKGVRIARQVSLCTLAPSDAVLTRAEPETLPSRSLTFDTTPDSRTRSTVKPLTITETTSSSTPCTSLSESAVKCECLRRNRVLSL